MTDKVQSFITDVITGSLAGQIALERDLDFAQLTSPKSPALRAISREITDLGIDPSVLSNHVLNGLVALFASPHNAEVMTENLTQLIWTILGDPKNGGEKPPPLYQKAGQALHLTFVSLLDPSVSPLSFDD
jgi:hypothetical protein